MSSIASKFSGIPNLIKLENTLFVLPFTYIGMLLTHNATLSIFILITIALVTLRGAAFSSNRYVGWESDKKNPAKKKWVSITRYKKSDILLICLAFIIIFMLCAYALNRLAFELAPLVAIIAVLEPYAKSYTAHRHFSMGLVIGLGILGGYIGASGTFPTIPSIYVLLLGYALFSGANDIVHTTKYMEFDRNQKIKTYPQKYGKARALRYAMYAHSLASLLFVIFGLMIGSIAVAVAGLITWIIFLLEHESAKRSGAEAIGPIFFYYNAAVSFLMLAAVAASLWL
jgi:4-hydroxybenzoate polyprenyltransferase